MAETRIPSFRRLALDTDAAPASILLTEANDQINQLVAHRRSTRTAPPPPTAPLMFGRFPVPSQQRVRGDQHGPPPCPREQSAQCSEDRSIGRPIANPRMQLPFENQHLVAEHHDLDVFVRLRAPGRHDEAEDPRQADVEDVRDL